MIREKHPIAIVDGDPYFELPKDLFIPPDALEVWLESFSGPLDLLLYLVKKQNKSLLDISLLVICEQYQSYIEWLESHRLPLAADYLVMAATLIEIKSRLLLPKLTIYEDDDGEDPAQKLIKQLQLYKLYQDAAEKLDCLPRKMRDVFVVQTYFERPKQSKYIPPIHLLYKSYINLMNQNEETLSAKLSIYREKWSIKNHMNEILTRLKTLKKMLFIELLKENQGKMGVVVSFLALLNLAKQNKILIEQKTFIDPIMVMLL